MDTYDFTTKHLYRARREIAIDRMSTVPLAKRRVAYLDTAEALDTIAYLKRGYRPDNLWAINRSSAEVANLTMKLRRLGWPDVQTVGLDFEDALTRRVPEVDVIDFDGMKCVTPTLMEMLGRIVYTRRRAVYGVTVLGGRESKSISQAEKKLANYSPHSVRDWVIAADATETVHTSFGRVVLATHAQRAAMAVHGLNVNLTPGLSGGEHGDAMRELMNWPHGCMVHITRVLWDSYVSASKQAMVWVVAHVEPHRDISPATADAYRRATKGVIYPWCHRMAEEIAARRLYDDWEPQVIGVPRRLT